MDGFEQGSRILVLGATNQLDNLDDAALRPGRFDTKIHVPKPDEKGRAAIFDFYLRKISHDPQISAEFMAKLTPGMSPAEIKNLVNTAICDTVNDERFIAKFGDMSEARDKIMMGLKRKTLTMTELERLRTSIHEMGHTLTCIHT